MLNTLSHSSHRCGPLAAESGDDEHVAFARGLAVTGVVFVRGLISWDFGARWLSLLLLLSVVVPYGEGLPDFPAMAVDFVSDSPGFDPPGAGGGEGVNGTAA